MSLNKCTLVSKQKASFKQKHLKEKLELNHIRSKTYIFQMLFYCNCCSFYFISNKGWGKENRVKYKFLSSQSVWCFVITTRRCWPNWKSRWWCKIRNRLVRAQKKLRDRLRWNTPHLEETWTRVTLVILWFSLCFSHMWPNMSKPWWRSTSWNERMRRRGRRGKLWARRSTRESHLLPSVNQTLHGEHL